MIPLDSTTFPLVVSSIVSTSISSTSEIGVLSKIETLCILSVRFVISSSMLVWKFNLEFNALEFSLKVLTFLSKSID